MVIVLWGAVRALSDTRSAAVFFIPVKGITSNTRGTTFTSSMRHFTSSSTILPSGPVPLTRVRSMPCSLANLLAAGEAMTCSLTLSTGFLSGMVTASLASITGAAAATSISGSSSSGAVMMPRVPATGTSIPSGAKILRTTPEAGASTSYVAFSESTSTKGSPFFTMSPSSLNH